MVNPISALFADGITETFILENEYEILGMIKADIGLGAVMIHPTLYKTTKTTVLAIKNLFKEVSKRMKDKYKFNVVSAVTHNYKFVNIITENKAIIVMQEDDNIVYEMEIV
jgi:hypothetical protein|tara:strand:+ start:50 stop:382 length:333 start_codon:yes stop_codon:yes gene_type:complete